MMKGKRLVITGGTGSFGTSAVPLFLEAGAAQVTIFSRDEYKQFEMRRAYEGEQRLRFVLGDVRDPHRLNEAVKGADYLIHTAAMKQVPSCEENPEEAIRTNVLGTANVVAAAVSQGVDCAINLSADKALYASSVYGATKLLAERLFVDGNSKGSTRLVSLRYSNVMASRGSVFEVFRDRIARGDAIKVFDPRMRRFFLTQKDVIDLCLFAFENSVGGEIYVKESRPVSIVDLGKAMIQAMSSGRMEVQEQEARTGEKLDAVLLSREESLRTVRCGDVFIVNSLGRDLKLDGLTPVEERDYTVDDYEPMEWDHLMRMVREEMRGP